MLLGSQGVPCQKVEYILMLFLSPLQFLLLSFIYFIQIFVCIVKRLCHIAILNMDVSFSELQTQDWFKLYLLDK